MQYTTWLCMMPWKLWLWKQFPGMPNAMSKTLLSFHFVSLWQMCTPSQLSPQGWGIQFLNFLHIHLQLMCRVCKRTDRKSWMNYISEPEPSSFIPLHDATALPVQRLLVGTNVFCDKDQKNIFIGPAAKDKNTFWTGFQG